MGAFFPCLPERRRVARAFLAIVAAAVIAGPVLTRPAQARGPEAIADVAEQVIDAVVNISTKQSVDIRGGIPQLPPGSPFEKFFEEFFKNRKGQNGAHPPVQRRINSLGSGRLRGDQQPRHRRCR
jgi:serine protease Do